LLALLCGGSGSAKFLRGLKQLANPALIVNVGDNYWFYGLYVCPDVDIITYEMADLLDESKGWGIRDDSFNALAQLGRYGLDTWFQLGDRDLATCLARTFLLGQGLRLTEISGRLARALGVRAAILPASDDYAPTLLETDVGLLHLQEFWVREGGRPRVRKVLYRTEGRPATEEALAALREARAVIIAPANPITSIGPILALEGIREALAHGQKKVIAVSPLRRGEAYSGPAAKLMRELGLEPSSATLARLYKGMLTHLLVDVEDEGLAVELRRAGIEVAVEDLTLDTANDSLRVARKCLEAIGEL
jgi:LPPG:FO 2-phospho-L-lactate transferase